MAIALVGVSSSSVLEVPGTTFRAVCVSPRPLDYGALGHFRKAMLTGTMAAGIAANAELWHFRWAHPTAFAVIARIELAGFSCATAFAVGLGILQLQLANGWTADGSGGTAATFTGNIGKLRASSASSLLALGTGFGGAMRCATTAALTAGTKSVVADYYGAWHGAIDATANRVYTGPHLLFGEDAGRGAMPIVLAQNDGALVRVNLPATGTWQAGVMCQWAEVMGY